MEIKHIKELMTAMERTGTKRLRIVEEGFELELEHQENGVYKIMEPILDADHESHSHNENTPLRQATVPSRGKEMPIAPHASLAPHSQAPLVEDTTSLYVTSPMVGTFYSSPSPDDPTFVKVGDMIEKQTVVCIIEAMKVMNEVKAGVSGTVAEILVESGHPVEFGTKLFRII